MRKHTMKPTDPVAVAILNQLRPPRTKGQMMYLFTIEQLAERGYAVYASSKLIAWCWACKDFNLVQPASTKADAIAAASAHCRENYVPPRQDGVPERAKFRLPKAGDMYLTLVGNKYKATHDWEPSDFDLEFNNRRWCWREDEEKPKAAIDETVEVSEITKEVLQETLSAMGKHKPMPTRHDAYGVIKEELDEFWDEVRERKPDPAKMRRELIQVAAMAVRAIHDAKWWEE